MAEWVGLNMLWLDWIGLGQYRSGQAAVDGWMGEWVGLNMLWLDWIGLGQYRLCEAAVDWRMGEWLGMNMLWLDWIGLVSIDRVRLVVWIGKQVEKIEFSFRTWIGWMGGDVHNRHNR